MAEIESEEEVSFAELFESSNQSPSRGFAPGSTVSGIVVKVGKETVFVDLGGKSEGFADIEEFRDKDGNLNVKEGDRVNLRVASLRGGIHLSKAMKVHGAEAVILLREAQQNQMPVEGRVAAVNKGGFEVEISGMRAFCPLSQIGLQYCEKPEEHVGARYQFRIIEMKEKGKNIIVSRRVLLQEEQEKKAQETMALLKPDLDIEGQVTRVTDFGAFVDIGGVEGMVHVSELTRARVKHPSEILAPGQVVRVKILKIEPEKNGRQKIALSMKALEPEAWDKGFTFKEGEVISGTVSRLTDYGAFVEVAPGLDGLVHVSEISYQRVRHPSRLLKEGDRVDVLVLKIDEEKRRISLSIKDAAIKQQMAGQEGEVRLEVGQVLKGIVEDQKPYGLFIKLPQLGMEVRGLLPMEELIHSDKGDVKRRLPKGKEIQVEIVAIDEKGRIQLSQKVMKEKEDRQEFQKFLTKEEKVEKLGTLGEIFQKLKK
ncbi:MAG: S1 RNA-binding domain-containing protein [Deltaproteobacteria bacterium]|nr:S1 RNA-binding domain-containing protein [Deltaproteobacteria bacterium]